jgi:hypothetical protein
MRHLGSYQNQLPWQLVFFNFLCFFFFLFRPFISQAPFDKMPSRISSTLSTSSAHWQPLESGCDALHDVVSRPPAPEFPRRHPRALRRSRPDSPCHQLIEHGRLPSLASILQVLARIIPGATTTRVRLNRWRGVNIGKDVWIGYDAIIETSCPHLVTIGDRAAIGIRATIIAHNREQQGVVIEEDVTLGPGVPWSDRTAECNHWARSDSDCRKRRH